MEERSEEQLEQQIAEQQPGPDDAAPEVADSDTPVEESPAEPVAETPKTPVAESTEPTPAPEMPASNVAATVGDDDIADAPAEEIPAAEASSADADNAAGESSAEAAPPKPAPKRDPAKVQPLEEIAEEELEEEENLDRDWYILKVQSNREKSIRDALERRVKVAGLERFFGDIIVPTEDVVEFKNGKRRISKRKLWPGYIVVNMAINDDTWFLVRETPGIGDFTGSIGKPTPMLPEEVERIIPKPPSEDGEEEQIKTDIPFNPGDRVRVKEGYFQNFEGDVDSIDEAKGRVTVMISVFGRPTPVELEHWHIENI